MPSSLVQLLTNPWFYVVGGVLVWVGRLAIQQTVRAAVDHQFALRIESHKHELQRIAEQERFDLQRRLAASNLYLQKQHAAAADVYSVVRVAHGFISNLFGMQRSLTLEDCNESDLRTLMGEFEVLEGKQDDLIRLWQTNPTQGADAIKAHLFELRVPRAEAKLQAARNTVYVNEIYFSDTAILALDRLFEECNKWVLRAAFPPQRGDTVVPLSREALNAALENVHSALRAELSDPPRLGRQAWLPAKSDDGS